MREGQGTDVIAESRRSDYDVTDTVLVSSAPDVRAAIEELFAKVWPDQKFPAFAHVFGDFERMFSGRMPGYFGVDTVYHDQQHTLDITLATARLIVGHELQVPDAQKFGPERAMLGIVVALFHDVGYLRTTRDTEVPNGAEFTTVHVSRGAAFLTDYLPKINLGHWAKVAAEIIHYTGYERPFKTIVAPDPRDHKLGHLVGTADLMAQMADRCYLEKCRDRLYAEFVLAGRGAADRRKRPRESALRLGPRPAAPDAEVRVRHARQAARRRVQPRVSLPGNPLRRPQSRTWSRSTATSNTCSASCAARTGACCGVSRRCSPASKTPWRPRAR